MVVHFLCRKIEIIGVWHIFIEEKFVLKCQELVQIVLGGYLRDGDISYSQTVSSNPFKKGSLTFISVSFFWLGSI